jgi:glutamate-5-semialdehyde dehydrogenase
VSHIQSPEEIAASLAEAAHRASTQVATAPTDQKNQALLNLVRLLQERVDPILEANGRDLEAGRAQGLSGALMDRLSLNPERILAMAEGVRQVVDLPDPVGSVESMGPRPNGLEVSRVRIPLGVICIIYESRPNVTIDAGALCLKSGNVPLLKGGREALNTNMVLVDLMREALTAVDLPSDAVQAVATSDRAVLSALIRSVGQVDLVIPRGGEGLIRYVTANATVPVIQHYKGVCHVYVDKDADLQMGEEIAFNAKVQRPGVCNAMETLLLHRDVAPGVIPALFSRYEAAGVSLRTDARIRALWPGAAAVGGEDWDTEYLDLILSVRLVDDIDQALEHIRKHGSGHTEAIVTEDSAARERFLQEVDASCVIVNASTRFNDGFELGLGAEIGISTSRIHAFGPMGLEELTTRKFVVRGSGQIRA